MTFFEENRYIVNIFQLSGLYPISFLNGQFHPPSKFDRLGLLSIFYICSMIIICICSIVHDANNLGTPPIDFASVVYFTMTIPMRLHAVTVLTETFLKRWQQFELLCQFAELEQFYHDNIAIEGISISNWRFRRYPLVSFLKTFLIISVLVYFYFKKNEVNIYTMCLYYIPMYINAMNYGHSSYYIDTICSFLELLNDSLQLIRRDQTIDWDNILKQARLKPVCDEMTVRQRIKVLKESFSRIWKASQLINSNMRWSIPLGINNEFVLFVINCYWIAMYFIQAEEAEILSSSEELIIPLLWIISNITNLFCLTYTCESTELEFKRLHEQLHCINMSSVLSPQKTVVSE